MKRETCSGRVEAISAQIEQLEAEGEALQNRRRSLDLPVLKLDFLDKILTDLQAIVEAIPNPQKSTSSTCW